MITWKFILGSAIYTAATAECIYIKRHSLYDVVVISTMYVAFLLLSYYSIKLDKARREGKIRYIGKTRL